MPNQPKKRAEESADIDELLLESARLIARLAVSLKIHKDTASVEPLESHRLYAREVKRFQPLLLQMETGSSSSPSGVRSRYEALKEIHTIAAGLLR